MYVVSYGSSIDDIIVAVYGDEGQARAKVKELVNHYESVASDDHPDVVAAFEVYGRDPASYSMIHLIEIGGSGSVQTVTKVTPFGNE